MIGGVKVDEYGGTTLPGLWAAGEVTSSGLARRQSPGVEQLARRAGLWRPRRRGARALRRSPSPTRSAAPAGEPPRAAPGRGARPADIRNSLKSLVWRAAGVRRTAAGLQRRRPHDRRLAAYALAQQFNHAAGWELQNMLTVARVMIAAALRREESRGVHLRTDFPKQDDEHWKVAHGGRSTPAGRERATFPVLAGEPGSPGRRSLRYRHAKTLGLGLPSTAAPCGKRRPDEKPVAGLKLLTENGLHQTAWRRAASLASPNPTSIRTPWSSGALGGILALASMTPCVGRGGCTHGDRIASNRTRSHRIRSHRLRLTAHEI